MYSNIYSKLTLFLFLLHIISGISQTTKFDTIISHYQNTGEYQKQEAARFLKNNLKYHKSIQCIWYNPDGTQNTYNELNYEDYITAKEALLTVKKNKAIQPRLITSLDLDSITPHFLIENIDNAFKSWKENPWSKKYSFITFCEYILPYRSLIEPVETTWRKDLQLYHKSAVAKLIQKNDPVELCTAIINQMKHFTFVSSRINPQPLLSLSQLQFRREGNCPDLANYAILANRANGIATTMDFTPHFAASSNRHFWNTVVDNEGAHIPFNANLGDPYTYNPNYRRMGKVLRRTFSKQENSLASIINPKHIPSTFITDTTIKDVTSEYVNTSDIIYSFKKKAFNKINYLSVFNKGSWKVLWWGKENNNGTTTFKNMGRNIIYLPTQVNLDTYNTKTLNVENYPLLLSKKGNQILLKPSFKNTYSGRLSKKEEITANNQDYNTLEFENGEDLLLYYWDGFWKFIDVYPVKNKEIEVKNIPKNALFRLVPKESDGFERIFILDKNFKMQQF